jgi:hypothetical protein
LFLVSDKVNPLFINFNLKLITPLTTHRFLKSRLLKYMFQQNFFYKSSLILRIIVLMQPPTPPKSSGFSSPPYRGQGTIPCQGTINVQGVQDAVEAAAAEAKAAAAAEAKAAAACTIMILILQKSS